MSHCLMTFKWSLQHQRSFALQTVFFMFPTIKITSALLVIVLQSLTISLLSCIFYCTHCCVHLQQSLMKKMRLCRKCFCFRIVFICVCFRQLILYSNMVHMTSAAVVEVCVVTTALTWMVIWGLICCRQLTLLYQLNQLFARRFNNPDVYHV